MTRKTLKIKENAVVEEVVEDELQSNITKDDDGTILYKVDTPKGEAVYKFIGNCLDCENEKVETPLFRSISAIRADEEIGNNLGCGINDGGSGTNICQTHYALRFPKNRNAAQAFKIIEKRW